MREKDSSLPFRSIATVSEDKGIISLIEYLGLEFDEESKKKELIDFPNHFLPHPYTFDYIFGMDSTQEEVYEIASVPSIESLVEGYNSIILYMDKLARAKFILWKDLHMIIHLKKEVLFQGQLDTFLNILKII